MKDLIVINHVSKTLKIWLFRIFFDDFHKKMRKNVSYIVQSLERVDSSGKTTHVAVDESITSKVK